MKNIFYSGLGQKILSELKRKFPIDNLYKTIFEAVGSAYSSYTALRQHLHNTCILPQSQTVLKNKTTNAFTVFNLTESVNYLQTHFPKILQIKTCQCNSILIFLGFPPNASCKVINHVAKLLDISKQLK